MERLRWPHLNFLILLLVQIVPQRASAATPVKKVIQVLTDMKTTASQELSEEADTFAKYVKFHAAQARELGYEINRGKNKAEELTATITKAESDQAQLKEMLASIDSQVQEAEAEKAEAESTRAADHKQYLQDQTDYEESIYALEHAIRTLSAQNYDRPQAEALLQEMTPKWRGMSKVLAAMALMQRSSSDQLSSEEPAVAGYEFQSQGLLDMLQKLHDEFKEQLLELETAESNQDHAFGLKTLHLRNLLDSLQSDRSEAAARAASTAQLHAQATAELKDVQQRTSAAADELADAKATFSAKQAIFEQNQEVRQSEITAIAEALKILTSAEVSDAYARRINAMTQLKQMRATSLLQMRSDASNADKAKLAAQHLRTRGTALNSQALVGLAASLQDATERENPFAKVIQMIEGLLHRLKDEASAEAEHKEWCDKELHKNKLSRKKKEEHIASLKAQEEEKKALVTSLAEDIAALVEEQAVLRKAVSEATAQRSEEKAENNATIVDAKAGRAALQQAIAVLEDFYSSTGGKVPGAAGFLQLGRQVPELEVYKGMQGKKVGVLGLLEVIESDFARLEADTTAAEEQAAAEYKKFMDESKSTLEAKGKREFKLSLEKDQAEFEQHQLEKERESTQVQLDKANDYYAELTPLCVKANVSYEERVAHREEEIEALREAYRILDGSQAATPAT